MNSWPTLKALSEFAAILALELLLLYAITKLVAQRLRSVQWQRALWQITLVSMFLAAVGELNGVRGWFERREVRTLPVAPGRAVVVTVREPDPSVFVAPPIADMMRRSPSASPPARTKSERWEQPAKSLAISVLAIAALLLLRMLAAQLLTLGYRMASRRWGDSDLNELVRRIAALLRIERKVGLARSFKACAPFTFGVWRPVIVLPHRFTEMFGAEQRQVALAHELAHIAGFDSAWRVFSQLLCAMLWWNPFVWLAAQELERASELVADESSLLVQDGPGHLAECLVQCAKAPRPPALAAWLGMDGGRFRSALGQRIARLLHLRPPANVSRPVPLFVRGLVPLFCVMALWFGITVITPSSQKGSASWHHSILGTAFAAAAAEKPTTNSLETTRVEVARLVQDGRLFYETGRLLEAEKAFLAALKLAATNATAAQYLDWIQTRRSSDPALQQLGRRRVPEKLRNLRLPQWGPINGRPLQEVLWNLSDEIRRIDPAGEGISVIFRSQVAATNQADVAVKRQYFEEQRRRVEVGSISPLELKLAEAELKLAEVGLAEAEAHPLVRLESELRDVTVEQILDTLCMVADRKIKYSIGDDGVVFTPRTDEAAPELHTRFFKVDPNTIMQGLRSLVAFGTNAAKTKFPLNSSSWAKILNQSRVMTNSDGTIVFLAVAPLDTNAIPALQTVFKSVGVDMTVPGKTMYYNDRRGVVMVRATLRDLETIEKLIQLLNVSPQQVTIRVKALEVTRDEKDRRFDWFLGNVLQTNAPDAENAKTVGAAEMNRLTSGSRDAATVPAPTITGILTDEQYRTVIRALESRGGTDLLSAPEVTTLSGRQAQIKVVDIRYIVTDLDNSTNQVAGKSGAKTSGVTVDSGNADGPRPVAEPFELGPIVDVVPYVLGDGQSIQMTVIPTLKEFLGYDDPGAFVVGDKKGVQQPVPLPKFRLRQAATTAVVHDGQTLVIGAGSARNVQQKAKPDGTVTNAAVEKELFFFITTRLIDPAGNSLHSDEQLKELHKSVPKQAGQ